MARVGVGSQKHTKASKVGQEFCFDQIGFKGRVPWFLVGCVSTLKICDFSEAHGPGHALYCQKSFPFTWVPLRLVSLGDWLGFNQLLPCSRSCLHPPPFPVWSQPFHSGVSLIVADDTCNQLCSINNTNAHALKSNKVSCVWPGGNRV